MHPIQFDATPVTERNRLTAFFRLIMAIPLLIVAALWGAAACVVTIVQWFVCVFTGKRNRSMFDFTAGFASYMARVYGYYYLLHDTFPKIASSDDTSTVTFSAEYSEDANRATTFFRIIMTIPAYVVSYLLTLAVNALGLLSWLTILFTGKQPSGVFDFMVRCLRYQMRTQSYVLLLTDTYPKFD